MALATLLTAQNVRDRDLDGTKILVNTSCRLPNTSKLLYEIQDMILCLKERFLLRFHSTDCLYEHTMKSFFNLRC